MNKVILIGRLTRDPEVRYSQASEPMAIARYSLAVERRFKRDGDQDADFLNCVAFGKSGEFAGKYFTKGMKVSVVGRLQTGSYDDKNGVKRYTTDIIIEEQDFCESKRAHEETTSSSDGFKPAANEFKKPSTPASDFKPMATDFDNDDDLPF